MSEEKTAKAPGEQMEVEQPQSEQSGEKDAAGKEPADTSEKSATEGNAESGSEAVTATLKELTSLQEENERLLNSLARLQADFDNYRKRLANEKKEWHSQAVCELMRELLPVIDNLERAMQAEGPPEALLEGVALVYRQLMDVLGRQGLEVIEACGNEFNPYYHHAVMQVESDQPENTVVEELQKGYKVKERVLRPSMVKVAK